LINLAKKPLFLTSSLTSFIISFPFFVLESQIIEATAVQITSQVIILSTFFAPLSTFSFHFLKKNIVFID
jgi:hypothetical protein